MPRFNVDHPALEDEEVVKEYDNSVRIITDGENSRDDFWVVQTGPGKMETHEFRGYEARKNAKLCAELLSRGGTVRRPIHDRNDVPISVAILGNPAISAYLRLVTGARTNQISQLMGFSTSTISQYLSDFAEGRR